MVSLKDKQKRILKEVRYEELSTTKIAFLISVNYYQAGSFLVDLEKKNLIKKSPRNNATYWKITDEGIKFLLGMEDGL